MSAGPRLSTGIAALDELLGGGLLPGTLTAVVGATGVGKTQLGLQFAAAGQAQEGRRGILLDMTYCGDSQAHAEYTRRMFDWHLRPMSNSRPRLEGFFEAGREPGDYLRVFDPRGRRQIERESSFDGRQAWRQELIARLDVSIAFFYGNFIRGVRRAVIDGIDPRDRPSESVQFELFDYVYHQVVRKEAEWVARDLFRQDYRRQAPQVAARVYDAAQIGCLMLYTSPESMLDDLIERELAEGDWLANANTIVYLGKTRDGNRVGRALYIAKHRGSYAADEIVPFRIDDTGIHID